MCDDEAARNVVDAPEQPARFVWVLFETGEGSEEAWEQLL
jgi:hypothetical protein